MLGKRWILALALAGSSAMVACGENSGSFTEASDEGVDAVESALTSSGVTSTLKLDNDWGGGYCATVTLANTSAVAVSNWSVVLGTGGSTITSLWSGTYVASGSNVTVKPVDYNKAIPARGSVSFGFCGNGTGRPTITSQTIVGGSTTGSGGGTSTGGGSSTGGSTSTGGGTSSGGGVSTGGTSTGGASTGGASTGGSTSTGGSSTGGSTSTGGTTAIDANAIYVSPTGSSSAAGTLSAPTNLATALSRVIVGQTIYLRGGNYPLSSTIKITKSGTSSSRMKLKGYPLDSTRPKLDFSAMSESGSNRGIELSGSYWHMHGFDIFNAGDNCMFMSGANNVVEFMTFSECNDTGLQLGGGASNNTILNCDSYFNADSALENADGFAAKLDVGSGNKFIGCRAWNNLDDGWDGYLRGADNISTTYANCWAIDNGKLKSGAVGAGDGNGFKTGGSDGKDLKHNATYTQCIAAGNVNDGFDHNSNRGSVTLLNCGAHSNGTNINFSTSNIAAFLKIKNTAAVGSTGSLNASSTDISNNSWQNGRAATSADYASLDTSLLKAARKSDGSLPDVNYMKLVAGSDLINAGVSVGLTYKGSAPDIGPLESN